MRKILYLNGFQSKLIPPKKETLVKYGKLIAPYIDHHYEKDIYLNFEKIIIQEKIEVIIGSSMGGALGFLLSSNHNIPALLFNPAIPYYEGKFNPLTPISVHQKCILGKLDTIIDHKDTMQILNTLDLPTLKIKILPDLKHKIPVAVFETQIEIFMNELKNRFIS